MFTDYHSHLLPAMDDGAKDVQMSLQMLDMWRNQGVERVVTTPHFYSHMEPPENFLKRREAATAALSAMHSDIRVISGAEVYLEKGVSGQEAMRRLTLGDSNYILIELPYGSYKEWISSEIYQTAYNWGLVPVIAHLERYLQWYSKKDMAQLLLIQDAVIQINNDALFKRPTLKLALELMRSGFPVIFGSDAHNTAERPPNMEAAQKVLQARLKKSEYLTLTELNESLI